MCVYNLQLQYLHDSDPWVGILATDSFIVRYMHQHFSVKIPVQLVLG